MNEKDLRLACLDRAVKTVIPDEASEVTIARAQAYYDFVTKQPDVKG